MNGDQVLPDIHQFLTKFTVRCVTFILAAFFSKSLNSFFQHLSRYVDKSHKRATLTKQRVYCRFSSNSIMKILQHEDNDSYFDFLTKHLTGAIIYIIYFLLIQLQHRKILNLILTVRERFIILHITR